MLSKTIQVCRRGAPSTVSEQLRDVIAARGLTVYAVAQAAVIAPSIINRFVAR